MCGIAGLIRWEGLAPDDTERLARGAAALAHRGPDAAGQWADTHCALAFRRLKIIDLSAAADQPMGNEDGRLQLVFNGEIYNFRELRETLVAAGHTFKSQSDSEVLLHGYEAWGIDGLLPKLRGMFAFALWDSAARKLVLARDPLGVKPLYFAERPGLLVFASEPKALFAAGLVESELDPVALHQAFTYRYVPPPRSGFLDVEKLPPGHVAVADVPSRAVQYKRWWSLETPAPGTPDVKEWLESATARRLLADVPLGAWLSGGLDSGLVVACMPGEGSVKTFSAGFAQQAWDERNLARASAAHLHTQHTDFEVPADVFSLLPKIVWHADEPFFDSSCLPTYVLAEHTRSHVTVVLSGDGGDEAFAGYQRYVGMNYYNRWRKMGGWLRAPIVAAAKLLHPTPSRQGWDRLVRWLEKCRATEAAGVPPYVAATTLFEQDELKALYGDRMREATAELDGREYVADALRRAAKAVHPDSVELKHHLEEPGVLQRADLETYLPGDVLHKVDRMSMAHGLEVRSPFLDVDLLAAALAQPDKTRLPSTETKPLLRRWAEQRLPPAVARAAKRGFGVPLDDWFRGPLKAGTLAMFEDSHLVSDGILAPRFWEGVWRAHQGGGVNNGERLYALLAAEVWHRQFLSPATGAVAATPPATL